jgi:hypothetical protein
MRLAMISDSSRRNRALSSELTASFDRRNEPSTAYTSTWPRQRTHGPHTIASSAITAAVVLFASMKLISPIISKSDPPSPLFNLMWPQPRQDPPISSFFNSNSAGDDLEEAPC